MTTNERRPELVGFLGLGTLGAPMAANLLASGVSLTVWNRTPAKSEPLVANGARLARTPAEAVPRGGVVFTILWEDASLEEVVTGEGFLDALGDGLHVSMTTVTPETSRWISALHAARGSMFVEAPIFGPGEGARARSSRRWAHRTSSTTEKRWVPMQECFDVLRAAGFDPRPTLGMITTAILPRSGPHAEELVP